MRCESDGCTGLGGDDCDLGINEVGKLVKIIVLCNQSEKRAGSTIFQYFLEIQEILDSLEILEILEISSKML